MSVDEARNQIQKHFESIMGDPQIIFFDCFTSSKGKEIWSMRIWWKNKTKEFNVDSLFELGVEWQRYRDVN